MEYKKTRWRDITHELTGQVRFRPENSRRPLNIPIRETQQETKQKDYSLDNIKDFSFDSILFYGIVLSPFIIIILRVLYEFLFL